MFGPTIPDIVFTEALRYHAAALVALWCLLRYAVLACVVLSVVILVRLLSADRA